MSHAVSIYEVFSLMESEAWDHETGKPKEYGLRYVNSKGEIRTRDRVRKQVKTLRSLMQKSESTHSDRAGYDRAIKGLFPIIDLDTEEHRSIMAAQIIYFRNHGTKEWLKIKN